MKKIVFSSKKDRQQLKEYVILEFTETAEVATVLRSWLKNNDQSETRTLWLDKNIRKNLITKEDPKEHWETGITKILSTSGM